MEEKYVALSFPFTCTFLDYPNPTDFSLLIYLVGCEHNCKGCHNKKFQKYDEKDTDQLVLHTATLIRLIETKMQDKNIDSIILSGGDPLFDNNLYFTKKFCSEYGEKYKICVYTGYDVEYVKDSGVIGFTYLKCGKYDENLKQESFKTDYEMQLASSNQEFYNYKFEKISENGILKFY